MSNSQAFKVCQRRWENLMPDEPEDTIEDYGEIERCHENLIDKTTYHTARKDHKDGTIKKGERYRKTYRKNAFIDCYVYRDERKEVEGATYQDHYVTITKQVC